MDAEQLAIIQLLTSTTVSLDMPMMGSDARLAWLDLTLQTSPKSVPTPRPAVHSVPIMPTPHSLDPPPVFLARLGSIAQARMVTYVWHVLCSRVLSSSKVCSNAVGADVYARLHPMPPAPWHLQLQLLILLCTLHKILARRLPQTKTHASQALGRDSTQIITNIGATGAQLALDSCPGGCNLGALSQHRSCFDLSLKLVMSLR